MEMGSVEMVAKAKGAENTYGSSHTHCTAETGADCTADHGSNHSAECGTKYGGSSISASLGLMLFSRSTFVSPALSKKRREAFKLS